MTCRIETYGGGVAAWRNEIRRSHRWVRDNLPVFVGGENKDWWSAAPCHYPTGVAASCTTGAASEESCAEITKAAMTPKVVANPEIKCGPLLTTEDYKLNLLRSRH